MTEDLRTPQINLAKIAAGGNIAGAIFTAGSTAILLIGLPALWFLFPAAAVLGCGIALVLHFVRHENPGASWILPATKR